MGLSKRAGTISAQSDKFCQNCIEEDIQLRGFSVSYCEHQPAFVHLCARHGTPLGYNCTVCALRRSSQRMWRMAGTYECDKPNYSPVVELGHDKLADAGRLWVKSPSSFDLILAGTCEYFSPPECSPSAYRPWLPFDGRPRQTSNNGRTEITLWSITTLRTWTSR